MTVSYSAFVPPLHKDTVEDIWVGGLFWDGRSNTLEEQAMGPPLNPLEMANRDTVSIADKLKTLGYDYMFYEIYGEDALDDPSVAFMNMADAIATYERSSEVSPFNSKYDYFLAGEANLSEQETRGMMLFVLESKGNCLACHPSTESDDGSPPLFTDFTYDNLGVPKNPESPFYTISPEFNPDGFDFVDLGLGTTLNDPAENGKFRVPTLRNIAITAPYMHNGVFKTLYQVIAFYNTRDIGPWPPAEVSENVNSDEMGDLKLSNQEVEDLVAFLQTLTDGWDPETGL
jgi:cytochrome c peroxidase